MSFEQMVLSAEPVARLSDPVTSHAAARRVAPAAGELAAAIVDTVKCARQPLTAEAIAESVFAEYGGRWKHSTVETAISRAADRRDGKVPTIEICGQGRTSRGVLAFLYRVAS